MDITRRCRENINAIEIARGSLRCRIGLHSALYAVLEAPTVGTSSTGFGFCEAGWTAWQAGRAFDGAGGIPTHSPTVKRSISGG